MYIDIEFKIRLNFSNDVHFKKLLSIIGLPLIAQVGFVPQLE